MHSKRNLRQWALSTAVFAGLLFALASVDARVRDKLAGLVNGSQSLTPLGDQLTDVGGVVVTAIRHQSIENAPLMIFAVVGAVLFLFMFRV